MDYLDPMGVVVGLLVAIPIVWTWWQVAFGERRERRRWHREARADAGERPGILIVDLLSGKDIAAAVQHASGQSPALRNVPEDRRVTVRRGAVLAPDDMPDLMRDLRAAHHRLMDSGADVVHVFFAGPCIAAAALGAELSNSARVQLWHYDQGRYINFGPLQTSS
jgi:SMODS-associated and fused to various effectors sensor domain